MYCGKGEKLLLMTNFFSYPQYFVRLMLDFNVKNDQIFSSRQALIRDNRSRDNESRLKGKLDLTNDNDF